jgi:uncharacterized membrane protein
MESYIIDWLNLLFRWLHLIFGAAWIGTSFYFNWLNHSVRPPEEPVKGVGGQLFSVHGGHFYQILKYDGAPEKLPKTLHWFMWEAYMTWITGFCLLVVVYYMNAEIYLIDPGQAALGTWEAIGISLGFLAGGWIVYDLMCKSPLQKSPAAFAVLGFAIMTGAAFALSELFGSRAAYIHVGAMIGTMMAANVFFVIIPNQRKMVDAMTRGEEPDISLGAAGAFRSLHNNYLTLPVLFIMVSNHFPMTFGHAFNWAVLAALSLIGAGARHYFNLKHQGHNKVWILPVAALAMFALAFVVRPEAPQAPAEGGVSYAEAEAVIRERCSTCHAADPTFTGLQTAPQGVMYDTPQQIKAMSPKIKAMAVDSQTMPPGNITQITDEERALLGAWISQGARIE